MKSAGTFPCVVPGLTVTVPGTIIPVVGGPPSTGFPHGDPSSEPPPSLAGPELLPAPLLDPLPDPPLDVLPDPLPDPLPEPLPDPLPEPLDPLPPDPLPDPPPELLPELSGPPELEQALAKNRRAAMKAREGVISISSGERSTRARGAIDTSAPRGAPVSRIRGNLRPMH